MLISKVTVADIGDIVDASLPGPVIAAPSGSQINVPAAVMALSAAKAEHSCTHERRREPSVHTTYRCAHVLMAGLLLRQAALRLALGRGPSEAAGGSEAAGDSEAAGRARRRAGRAASLAAPPSPVSTSASPM
ncbi:MAG: hypothetical protein ABSA91_04380 [Acidimicrobiales bacterium]